MHCTNDTHPQRVLVFLFLIESNEHGEFVYPFLKGRKGGYHLVNENYIYRSNFRRQGVQRNIYYWECINNRKGRCRGRLKTIGDKLYIANSNGEIGAYRQKRNCFFLQIK